MNGLSLNVISSIFSWLTGLVTDAIGWLIDQLMEYVIEPILCLIPKTLYVLYASFASIGDVFQLIIRKIAGLDVYYVNGNAVTGDIVTNFIAGIFGIYFDSDSKGISYSALATVFWAFVIFGVVMCIISTIFAIVKGQYNYDSEEAKGGTIQHIFTMIRTLINMAVVPLVVVLGLYVSQAILTALDQITTTDTTDVVSMYGSVAKDELLTSETASGVQTYAYYDIFGYNSTYASMLTNGWSENWVEPFASASLASIATTTTSFSGMMFKTAAYNANRLRTGDFTESTKFNGNTGSDSLLFANGSSAEEKANLIDNAFAMNLHYNDVIDMCYDVGTKAAYKITMGNMFSVGLGQIDEVAVIVAYSKYNVNLLWYYYDLWNFNFLVGFAFIIIMLTVFTNIVFGLMQRVIMLLALFLVMPAAYGITPLDKGEMAKRWRTTFLQYVLGAYGAILGMNLIFLIMPYLNQIDFTNITLVDYIIQSLFIIVALISVKALISVLSSIVGGKDVNSEGGNITKEIGSAVGKAVSVGVGAVTGTVAVAKGLEHGAEAVHKWRDARKAAKGADAMASSAGSTMQTEQANQRDLEEYKTTNKVLGDIASGSAGDFTSLQSDLRGSDRARKRAARERIRQLAISRGLGGEETENIIKHLEGYSGSAADYANNFATTARTSRKSSAYNRAMRILNNRTFHGLSSNPDDAITDSQRVEGAARTRYQAATARIKARQTARAGIAKGVGEIAGGILKPVAPVFSGYDLTSEAVKPFLDAQKNRKTKQEKAEADEKQRRAHEEQVEFQNDSLSQQRALSQAVQDLTEEIRRSRSGGAGGSP